MAEYGLSWLVPTAVAVVVLTLLEKLFATASARVSFGLTEK